MRAICFLLLVVMASTVSANPFPLSGPARSDFIAAQDFTRPKAKGMLPNQRRPKVGDRQAAANVRQAYADHRILSMQLMEGRGAPVYRFKTLSDDGVVKYIYVDGENGNVFE